MVLQLILQPIELAPSARSRFAQQGVALGGLPNRVCSGSGLLPRPHSRAVLHSVTMGAVQPPLDVRSSRPTSQGCVQLSALAPESAVRYCAVNLRLFGLATTSGSGVGRASLDSSHSGLVAIAARRPRPERPSLAMSSILSLQAIGIHLHRPTVIPSGAGVSVMLAERGPI